MKNEKDPLLDELEERIAEGPIVFTPDEEFLKRVEERRKEVNDKSDSYSSCTSIVDYLIVSIIISTYTQRTYELRNFIYRTQRYAHKLCEIC